MKSFNLKQWWGKPANKFIFYRILISLFNLAILIGGVVYIYVKLKGKL